MGKSIFNCINVGIFLLLGVLIVFHAKGTFKCITASDLIIAYAILFLSAPAFGQSFLWLDGSATYSLGIVIALAYLIPFRKAIYQIQHGTYTKGSFLTQLFKFLYTFALGILAGNTSENVGAAMIIFILLCGIFVKLHHTKLQLWMLGLGNIAGTILAVMSPGTQSRLESTGGLSVVGMIKNIVFIGADFVEYLRLPLCIFAGLLIAYMICTKHSSVKAHLEKNAALIIYFVSTLAAAFSMILSTQFPARAWSIVSSLSAIVVILCFESFSATIPHIAKIRISVVTLLIVFSIGTYTNSFFRLKAISAFHQAREELIVTAVQNGEKCVEIPAIASNCPHSVFDPIGDLSEDSSSWPNTVIARYYGIDEVKRASEDFDY